MTHEQILSLRTTVKESGTGVQGHSRLPVENGRAIPHIHQHRERGASLDAAIKAVAVAEMASPTTIRSAYNQFITTGTLNTPEDGRSHRAHPFHRGEAGPPLAAELLIHHLDQLMRSPFSLATQPDTDL